MDEKQLQALANELAKNLKTPEDLSQFDRLLKKLSVEAALNAEMTHHPGYEKNQSRPGANSRNGYSTKTVITGDGPLELRTPRDRDGTFEPQLVKKNQTRISKRLARTVLIFTESSDQLSRATDRVPGLPASPGYAQ
ncbi:transposase [Escherichia coli]|uniref:transposase n=1 Tax=Escherichia coli TaxID=562 RepID=UPI003D6B80CF